MMASSAWHEQNSEEAKSITVFTPDTQSIHHENFHGENDDDGDDDGLSIDDLCGVGEGGPNTTSNSTSTFIDSEGNLNRLG